jgi:5'-3' exonuclease
MINCIFDLSNMLYRSMFSVSAYGTKQYTFDTQEECDVLLRKVTMDISYIMRSISPSRVIFALDSSSWRKKIKIEENEGYKGNREKSKNLNWDNIYNALDEFAEIMNSNGYITTKINDAEGDDIMTLWSYELNTNQHQHVIIVTGDEDMRQLVKSLPLENNKFAFVTIFNPFTQGKNNSKKLYHSKHFVDWLKQEDVCDIFNLTIDVDKEDFNKLQKMDKVKFEEIDGNLIKMRKIFCGDDGDNIPSIFTWEKNGKEVRFTESKFKKLLEVIGDDCDHNRALSKANIILENIKIITKQNPVFNIKERLNRQIKLVALDPLVFPEEIRNEFNKIKTEELKRPKTSNTGVNMHQLLSSTRYVTTKPNNKSTIFSELDRLNTNKKPLF